MAEITQPAHSPLPRKEQILQRALDDIKRINVIPRDCKVIDQHLMLADPAYVVLTPRNQATIRRAIEFLEAHDVLPLGRYGRWEYSSMGQVIRDAFKLAERQSEKLSI